MHAADIQFLFDYSYAATARILAAAGQLDHYQFSSDPPLRGAASLQHILVHVLDAEQGWREFLRTGDQHAAAELDPAAFPDVATLRAAWQADEQRMRAWLATLDDDALNVPAHRDVLLWQCLVHVVNHGTQHRSEAAQLLTHWGLSPGDLDLTFFMKGWR